MGHHRHHHKYADYWLFFKWRYPVELFTQVCWFVWSRHQIHFLSNKFLIELLFLSFFIWGLKPDILKICSKIFSFLADQIKRNKIELQQHLDLSKMIFLLFYFPILFSNEECKFKPKLISTLVAMKKTCTTITVK